MLETQSRHVPDKVSDKNVQQKDILGPAFGLSMTVGTALEHALCLKFETKIVWHGRYLRLSLSKPSLKRSGKVHFLLLYQSFGPSRI